MLHPKLKKLIATLVLTAPIWLAATEPSDDSIVELPAYQVRSQLFGADLANPVTHEATMLGAPISDIASILQQSNPDIGIIRKAGTSNDIIVRGLSQDNVNVNVDDTNTFCACSNRMDPPVSQVSSTMIQSIELTQGAFDLSHSGAMGGNVSIRTLAPSAVESLKFFTSYGSFSQTTSAISLTGGNERLANVIHLEYASADPYEDGRGRRLTDFPDDSAWPLDDYLDTARESNSYQAIHGFLKTKVKTGKTQSLELRYRIREDQDVLYPGLRMDADLTRTQELALTYGSLEEDTTAGGFRFVLFQNWTDHDMIDSRRMSARRNAMGMARPAYVLDRGYYMQSLAYTSARGARFTMKNSEDQTFAWEVGAEALIRDWDIDNRLGAGSPAAGPGAEIFNNMIPNTRSRTVGAYAQSSLSLSESTRLEAGMRLDTFYTKTRDDTTFLRSQVGDFDAQTDIEPSAKLLVRQDSSENLSWFAGLGSTVRIPNGQERYIQLQRPGTMPNWVGNPELKAPRNNEIAAGLLYHSPRWYVRAKGFYSKLQNTIYISTANLAKPTQTYANIDASLYGFDLFANLSVSPSFGINSGISYQRGRKDESLPGNAHGDLAEVPPLKAIAAVYYQHTSATVSVEVAHAQEQKHIDRSLGELPLDGYTIANVRARYRINNSITVSASIENLTDQTYAVHNAMVRNPFGSFAIVNEPGRSFFLSVEANF
jgi:iron complex outermembrane receptor protein